MSLRLGKPLVHGAWQAAWWGGHSTWSRLLGPAPRAAALDDAASRIETRASWADALHPLGRHQDPPAEALVVLAGQQPVLGGGAALVAHKAATAIALAEELADRWQRPVVPVFLLATQDHDSSEIDHLDTINTSKGSLLRFRCPMSPKSDMFCRAHWDETSFVRFKGMLEISNNHLDGVLESISSGSSIADHVAELLDQTFGPQGLYLVEAHRLPQEPTTAIMRRALSEGPELARTLAGGARALESVDRHPAFDPADTRPLVLESRDGRRRRLEPGDDQALDRLSRHPASFSPHAALRPIVQAATLPVVAQVCGPSEIVYLGQARELHQLFNVPAPALIPRLEATHLPASAFAAGEARDALLGRLDLSAGSAPAQRNERALLAAAREFAGSLRARDPGLAPRVQRFEERLVRTVRRLAEAPSWRGRGQLGPAQAIHPRGRYQDTTLSWLPQAWSADDPAGWARHIVSLAQPMAEPEHVVHAYPEDLSHG